MARAERVCATASAEQAPLKARQEAAKGLAAGPARTLFVALAHQLVTISRAAEAKLAALPRPARDASRIATLLSIFQG